MLRNLFALTEQGAKDLKKGIIASIFSSLSLMLPMGLMLMLVMQLLQPLSGIEANEPSLKLYVVLCIALLMIIFLTHYIQYRCTYIAAYKESAQRRIGLAEKLRMLPLSFFGKRDISDLTTTMMSDCSDLEKVFAYTIPADFWYGNQLCNGLSMSVLYRLAYGFGRLFSLYSGYSGSHWK